MMQNDLNLLKDIFRVLSRHKFKVLLFSFLVMGSVLAFMLLGPRKYASEGSIFIRLGRESVALDPTATFGETVMVQSSRRAEIQTAIDILLSQGLHEKVVDVIGERVVLGYEPVPVPASENHSQAAEKRTEFNLVASTIGPMIDLIKSVDPVSDREEAVLLIDENLRVDSEVESNVIRIHYKAESPRLAKAVVDTLLVEFLKDHVRLNRISGSREFFDEQVSLLKVEVDETSRKLAKLKNEFGLTSIDNRRSTIESQYQTAKQQTITKKSELADALARLKYLSQRVLEEPDRLVSEDTSTPNTGVDLMQTEYFKLKLRQLELSEKLLQDHPQRLAIDSQVAEAERAMSALEPSRQETTEDVNPIHQELRLEMLRQAGFVEGLEANLVELESELREISDEQQRLNAQELELQEVQMAYDQALTNLVSYQSRLEQTRMNQALEQQQVSNTNIVHQGTLNYDPVSPNKALLGIAGILLAVAGSFAIAFGYEQFDNTVKSARELRTQLGIPVLASVPKLGRITIDLTPEKSPRKLSARSPSSQPPALQASSHD